MAAGSVIKEPSNGTTDMIMKYMAYSRRMGTIWANNFTIVVTSSRMGRLAATTIMANTKAGSVKLRVFIYSTAGSTPIKRAIKQIRTKAQTPKTASTSDSMCHKPECGPPLFASRAKTGTENV